jgi:hypothetical protein
MPCVGRDRTATVCDGLWTVAWTISDDLAVNWLLWFLEGFMSTRGFHGNCVGLVLHRIGYVFPVKLRWSLANDDLLKLGTSTCESVHHKGRI